MRDKKYTSIDLENYILKNYESLNTITEWIETGKTPRERILIMKNEQFKDCRSLIHAKYSIGLSSLQLIPAYLRALEYMYESWMELPLKAFKKKKYYNHYFGGTYDEMLEMLSLGILLNQPKSVFDRLAEIIDKDQVKDKLYEYILTTKIPNRENIAEESYSEILVIPKLFKKLRLAIDEKNKVIAAKYIESYLKKDFIKRVTNESDVNKNAINPYWNFDSAALTKLLLHKFSLRYMQPKLYQNWY